MESNKEVAHINGRYGIVIALITLFGTILTVVSKDCNCAAENTTEIRDNEKLKEPGGKTSSRPEKIGN